MNTLILKSPLVEAVLSLKPFLLLWVLLLVTIIVAFFRIGKGALTRFYVHIGLWLTSGGSFVFKGEKKTIKALDLEWSKVVTRLFAAIPGILLPFLMFILLVCIIYFVTSGSQNSHLINTTPLKSWIVWTVLIALCAFATAKRLTKTIEVTEQTARRLEINGQGILSDQTENEVAPFVMLTEGKYLTLWFMNLSDRVISLRPQTVKTGKITTRTTTGEHIVSEFSETFEVSEPGLFFAANPENGSRKQEILVNIMTDFMQSFPANRLLGMTGKDIKNILILPSKDVQNIDAIRKKVANSSLEDYGPEKVLESYAKVIRFILLRENAFSKESTFDFNTFIETIAQYIGKLNHYNLGLGVTSIDINQLEMNYESSEMKKAAEQTVLTNLKNAADQLRIDLLTQAIDSIIAKEKSGKMSAQQAMEGIQIEFEKRQGFVISGNRSKNTNPFLNLNNKK